MTEVWIQEYLDDMEDREARRDLALINDKVAHRFADHLSRLMRSSWEQYMRQHVERYTRMYASRTLRRLQIATRVLERPYARFRGKTWDGTVEEVEATIPAFTVHVNVPRFR